MAGSFELVEMLQDYPFHPGDCNAASAAVADPLKPYIPRSI
jgi:hypothetical protein